MPECPDCPGRDHLAAVEGRQMTPHLYALPEVNGRCADCGGHAIDPQHVDIRDLPSGRKATAERVLHKRIEMHGGWGIACNRRWTSGIDWADDWQETTCSDCLAASPPARQTT